MREVFIDLSPDNHLQEVKVFGGYSGEQNETLLKIKLPTRMISNEFSYYYFKFEKDCGETIFSVPIESAQINNYVIEVKLWQQLTKTDVLKVNVIASDSQINESPDKIAMTNTIILVIKNKSNGQEVCIDPSAVKLQLLELIDTRVRDSLQNLGGAADQDYKPNSQNAQSGFAVAQAIETVQKQIDALSYKPMEIKLFTVSPSAVEIGTKNVDTLTFKWTLNKTPKTVMFNGNSVGTGITGQHILTDVDVSSSHSWKLTATDEKGATADKPVSLSFQKGIYFGVVNATDEITNDLILGLEKRLHPKADMELSFTATTTVDQKVIFALPIEDYNDPSFKIGSFEYAWDEVKTFEFENSSGHTESYTVWRSVQPVADTLNITAIATKK